MFQTFEKYQEEEQKFEKKRYSKIIQIQRINTLTDWLLDTNLITHEDLINSNLFKILKEGKLLCSIVLTMMDKKLISIQNEQMVRRRLEKKNLNRFEKMDTIQIFLIACKLIGFEEEELFTVEDLENEKENVISTLSLFKELIELKEFPVQIKFDSLTADEMKWLKLLKNEEKQQKIDLQPQRDIEGENDEIVSSIVDNIPLMGMEIMLSYIIIDVIQKWFD